MKNIQKKGAEYISAIDSLRAIAVILVIAEHCDALLFLRGWKTETLFGLFNFGIGVELFFVISGFVVFLNLQQSWPDLKGNFFGFWRQFLIRRFFRLAPACFFWLAVILICSRFIPPFMAWNPDAVLREAVGIITYTYNFLVAYNVFLIPGSSLGYHYSLAIEEQFYLLFPLVMLFTNRKSLLILCLSVILSVHLFERPIEWNYFRYESFCWGIIAAIVYLRFKTMAPQQGRIWDLTLSAIAWASLIALPLSHFIAGSRTPFEGPAAVSFIAVLAIAFGAKLLPTGRIESTLQLAGRISYSAYLAHMPIINLFNAAILSLGWSDQNAEKLTAPFPVRIAVIILMLLSIWMASRFSHRFIEMPARLFGKNISNRIRYQSGGGTRGLSHVGRES